MRALHASFGLAEEGVVAETAPVAGGASSMAWDKPMPARPVVAVAGATGAVGREMLAVLEQRGFPGRARDRAGIASLGGQELPFAGGSSWSRR